MTRIKLPRLKFPKMDKRKKKFLIVSLIVLSFFIAGSIMFNPNPLRLRNINDYSDISLIVLPLGTELNEGDTVQAQLNDIEVKLVWDNSMTYNNPSRIRCTLKGEGVNDYSEGSWVDVASDDITYVWTFALDRVEVGTHTNHFEFTGYYPDINNPDWTYCDDGEYITFYIHNLFQVVDPPEITSRPDDVLMPDDGSEMIVWHYLYNAPSTITLTMDGTVLKEQAGLKSISEQVFSHTYSPTEIGIYTFVFSLDPENVLHSTVSDTVSIEVITAEDYYLVKDLPDEINSIGIQMVGEMAVFGFYLATEWEEPTSTVPVDIYGIPRQGTLTIKVIARIGTDWFSVNSAPFGEVKLTMRHPDLQDEVFYFEDRIGIEGTFLGFTITAWEELSINLDTIESGEYDCDIRGFLDRIWYQISVFKLSINTFPIGWITNISGYILLFGVLSIVSIIAIRRFRGWWGFKGQYAK